MSEPMLRRVARIEKEINPPKFEPETFVIIADHGDQATEAQRQQTAAEMGDAQAKGHSVINLVPLEPLHTRGSA